MSVSHGFLFLHRRVVHGTVLYVQHGQCIHSMTVRSEGYRWAKRTATGITYLAQTSQELSS